MAGGTATARQRAKPRNLQSFYGGRCGARAYNDAGGRSGRKAPDPRAMLNWLVGTCELFGLSGQNWMLLAAGALLIYVVTLLILRRHRPAGWR
jgi:hypothetical protein